MKRVKKLKLGIQGIDEMGCCAYFSLEVNEDYTMRQLVDAVINRGYVKFRITTTMKVFADVY